MGNTDSSSLSPSARTPPASPSLISAGDEEELALIIQENTQRETASLLLSPFSNASSSPPDHDPMNSKKKKRHSSSETLMTNLHGEARDLAAMCFWVGAFLQQFNENNINKRSNQQEQEQTIIRISEDGYTPEETLHMLFAQQQQDEYQYPSNNNDQSSEKYGGSSPPLFVVESLQELQAQCHEYVQAHSQPGAPRIINARSRLRRRQRLIERPMTLLLSSSSSPSTADPFSSSSSHYGAIHETNDNNDIGNPKEVVEEEELFYGIVKDDVHQRIVLVFHETPTMMRTMQSTASWQDLLHVHQVPVPLPSTLQGKVPRDPTSSSTNNNNNNNMTTTTSLEFVDSIGLRADLYHFLFSNKSDCSNGSNNNVSRYQNLLTALQHVLRAHPSYTFHVTGFYGGAAACAVLVAFFLAAEPQAVLYNHVLFTTNPIVNCLAFACPRVGDSQFLQACQYLERGEPQQGKQTFDDAEQYGGDDCHNYSSPLLRMGRIMVVHDGHNDASAQIPMWNFSHVGFQIRLYQNDNDCSSSSSRAPEITYPKLVDHWTNRWNRTWGNAISIPSIWKLLHQHSQDARAAAANAAAANYRLAIQQAQGHLQEYKEGMTSLYGRDKNGINAWTGF